MRQKRSTRLLSLVLSLAMVLGTFTSTAAFAAGSERAKDSAARSAKSSFAEGSGTEEDPYQISTVAELKKVKNDLDASYVLTESLTIPEGTEWEPIGDLGDHFTGNFDGGNFTISGLSIDDRFGSYLGLFGYLDGATVQNLAVEVDAINGKNRVGGLAGYAAKSNIINCGAAAMEGSGTVTGSNTNVGGLIGEAARTQVDRCFASVNVEGGSPVGGLIGSFMGVREKVEDDTAYAVTNSMATGDVIGGAGGTGGLVGKSEGASILNSFATGTLSTTSSLENPARFVAGIVGGISWKVIGGTSFKGAGSVENSFFTGTVQDGGVGIAGEIRDEGTAFVGCYYNDAIENGYSLLGGNPSAEEPELTAKPLAEMQDEAFVEALNETAEANEWTAWELNEDGTAVLSGVGEGFTPAGPSEDEPESYSQYEAWETDGQNNGPVWYYQLRNKADQTYANFTNWNAAGFWCTSTYSEGNDWGIAAQDRLVCLFGVNSTYDGVAYAWKAPRDGQVSVSFETEITATKPDMVTVQVSKGTDTLAQDVLKTYSVSNSAPTTTATVDEITADVTAGDYIRVEAFANVNNDVTSVRPVVTYTSTTPVDKTELQKVYDENATKEQGSYTQASWDTFTKALAAAKTVLDNENATSADINTALTDLNAAIAGLTEIEGDVRVYTFHPYLLTRCMEVVVPIGETATVKWEWDQDKNGYVPSINGNKLRDDLTFDAAEIAPIVCNPVNGDKQVVGGLQNIRAVPDQVEFVLAPTADTPAEVQDTLIKSHSPDVPFTVQYEDQDGNVVKTVDKKATMYDKEYTVSANLKEVGTLEGVDKIELTGNKYTTINVTKDEAGSDVAIPDVVTFTVKLTRVEATKDVTIRFLLGAEEVGTKTITLNKGEAATTIQAENPPAGYVLSPAEQSATAEYTADGKVKINGTVVTGDPTIDFTVQKQPAAKAYYDIVVNGEKAFTLGVGEESSVTVQWKRYTPPHIDGQPDKDPGYRMELVTSKGTYYPTILTDMDGMRTNGFKFDELVLAGQNIDVTGAYNVPEELRMVSLDKTIEPMEVTLASAVGDAAKYPASAPKQESVSVSGGGETVVTGVKVSHPNAKVEKGTTEQFTAKVEGTNVTQNVTWTVTGSSHSTIDQNGLLTVPEDEPYDFFYVRATSVDDPTKYEEVEVRLVAADMPEGSGTEEDPYLLTTAEEFNTLRELSDTYNPKYFKLANDIDLSGYADSWSPIGKDRNNAFGGVVDGNGKTIRGLKVDQDAEYAGLFGYANHLTITNLTVEVVGVNGGNNTGALIGYANNSIVRGCGVRAASADSAVTGSAAAVGGLIGTALYTTVENSYADIAVEGATSVGGLIGSYSGNVSSYIENCYAAGNVTSTNSSASKHIQVGGLIGNAQKAKISNSFATGDITATGIRIGGLVGTLSGNTGSENAWIMNSYASGSITAGEDSTWVGGLVGSFQMASSVIENGYYNSDNGLAGCGNLVSTEDTTTGKTAAELKSRAFALEVNANTADESSWTKWGYDTAVNDSFPVLCGVGAGVGIDEVTDQPGVPQNLTVSYEKNVKLQVNGEAQNMADLIGKYQQEKVANGTKFTFTFTPRVESQAFRSVKIGDAEPILINGTTYTYEFTMGNAEANLNFVFEMTDKTTLEQVYNYAKTYVDNGTVDQLIGSVKDAFMKAYNNAKTVLDNTEATQAEINEAWGALMNAIHYLEFKPGDKTELQKLLDVANSLKQENFTETSWNAFVAVRTEAQKVADDPEALKNDIQKAHDDLYAAIMALIHATDRSQLDMVIADGEAILPLLETKYRPDGQEEFKAALEAAKAVAKDATQKEIDDAALRLSKATTALRLIPNKDDLKKLLAKVDGLDMDKYTSISASACQAAYNLALGVYNNPNATQKDITEIYDLLDGKIDGLKTNNSHNSSGGSGSSGNQGGGSYGGTGTAAATTSPVLNAAQNVTASASVRSDTTLPFTLKSGSAYCFKMTVTNGSAAMPSFTVGNGSVLKTQFVAKSGNDYYFRVWAVGKPGQQTGVYTQMPGENPQFHCVVAVG